MEPIAVMLIALMAALIVVTLVRRNDPPYQVVYVPEPIHSDGLSRLLLCMVIFFIAMLVISAVNR